MAAFFAQMDRKNKQHFHPVPCALAQRRSAACGPRRARRPHPLRRVQAWRQKWCLECLSAQSILARSTNAPPPQTTTVRDRKQQSAGRQNLHHLGVGQTDIEARPVLAIVIAHEDADICAEKERVRIRWVHDQRIELR